MPPRVIKKYFLLISEGFTTVFSFLIKILAHLIGMLVRDFLIKKVDSLPIIIKYIGKNLITIFKREYLIFLFKSNF